MPRARHSPGKTSEVRTNAAHSTPVVYLEGVSRKEVKTCGHHFDLRDNQEEGKDRSGDVAAPIRSPGKQLSCHTENDEYAGQDGEAAH